MTLFPDGGPLYTTRRPVKLPALLFLAAASLFIAACGTAVANTNWPGMTSIDNVVYVSYGQGVLAIDVTEGSEIWSYRPVDVGGNVQLFAEPSVVDHSIVVGDYGDSGGFLNPRITVGIYGLNDANVEGSGLSATPDEVWRNNESAEDRIIASPLQVGDVAYVGTADNIMMAINQSAGGAEIWKFETGKPVWARPVYNDNVLYMGSMDGLAYALNAEDGSEMWSKDLGGAVSANLVYENELLYVNSYNQSANALNPTNGEVVWTIETVGAVWGASAVSGEELYVVDLSGTVYAVNALTGAVRWTKELGHLVQAGPTIGDDIVYIVTAGDPELDGDERKGSVTALSTESGELVWQEHLAEPLYTPALVVGDSVVVAQTLGSELLLAYDALDGSLDWTYDRPGVEEEE